MTPHIDRPIAELLPRYWMGDVSPEEREAIERWRRADPERDGVLQLLHRAWDAAGAPQDADALLLIDVRPYVRARIRQPQGAFSPSRRPFARGDDGGLSWPKRWYVWSGATVAAVLLLLGSWKVMSFAGGGRVAPVTRYATTNGERANITLPDGSHVTLGAASQLEVPTDFGRGNGTLRLTGEALFTVAHHGRIPVTVVAGPTVARVLGTTFLVRRYRTDTGTVVAVRDGKVAVRSTVLVADQEAYVGRGGRMRVQPLNAGLFTFATGVLTLNDMTLAAAIPDLDRWYDVDIRLGDAALATEGIGGRFVAGSIADLSAVLGMTFNVRVVRDGRVLTLYPRQ